MAVLGFGVFIRAKDKNALADWYRDFLGIDIHKEYLFANIDPKPMAALPNSAQVFTLMSEDSEYFEPSKSRFMLNLCVDNIDEMIETLKSRGIEILWQDFNGEYGKFAHILDLENNKIELWQPPK